MLAIRGTAKEPPHAVLDDTKYQHSDVGLVRQRDVVPGPPEPLPPVETFHLQKKVAGAALVVWAFSNAASMKDEETDA
jgi:hypothetical protein